MDEPLLPQRTLKEVGLADAFAQLRAAGSLGILLTARLLPFLCPSLFHQHR
jgi:hypothetical protein